MKTVSLTLSALGLVAIAALDADPAQARAVLPAPATAAVCALDPETVPLRPTQNAPGGSGTMILVQPVTPFGIAVDPGGVQAYDVTVRVDRMRRRPGASYVVWAATPELDQVAKLGVLGDRDSLTGHVAWNKFMVFVSEERDPTVERWAGPILLTGLSPSGRMHTMAGHGPFEDVNCQQYY